MKFQKTKNRQYKSPFPWLLCLEQQYNAHTLILFLAQDMNFYDNLVLSNKLQVQILDILTAKLKKKLQFNISFMLKVKV